MGERQRVISGWAFLASGNFGSFMECWGRLQAIIRRADGRHKTANRFQRSTTIFYCKGEMVAKFRKAMKGLFANLCNFASLCKVTA